MAVFVGAQPGAGKSSILTRLRGRFRGNVALISGDDFRQFHPAYARLRDTDPVAMPNVTQTFSGPAVERAIGEARDRQVNVIIEGTYRDPATTFRTMQLYADAGYRTELVTVSTSIYASQIAAQQRYLDAVREGYDARWTPRSALRRGYDESAAILTAAMAVAACHVISVVDRDSVELARVARDAEGLWPAGANPEAVCREHREQTQPNADDYTEQVAGLSALAAELDIHEPEFERSLQQLADDAQGLVAHEATEGADAPEETFTDRLDRVIEEVRSTTVYARDDDADVLDETQDVFEDYRHQEREQDRGPRHR